MAFQKQFKTNYFSYNGWEYYMEIWVNTTAGTITTSEVKLGTGGPIISYDTDNEDRFSPIISSNCVIPLVIESSIQETFVKQLREVYNERDVYVHLYRATEAQHSTVKPLWSGFVLMDLSSTPDEFYPYDFKITAVDGLGLLKDIDFVKPTTRRANEYIQADMYYGPGRFTYWLKEILLKTGASTTVEGSSQDYEFTTAINWYESQMPNTSQSTDPFYITKCSVGMFHTKTDDGVYEVTNCYEVLKELLKHWGARITYWKGQFWIVQIPQYITPDSGTYINPDNVNTRTYDKSGTFIGSSDNLGDSYWTRYQLNIGDIDGGIQKLTGTNVNYLPQIREVRANNISFGGGNRYGGFPREFAGNSAPDEIIFQDQINDASDSDSFNLVIPLNVTVQNGNPFFMKILFNFYCTDLTNTYYLQYDTTLTHKYYWVDVSQWTTLVKAPTWDSGFISPATGNSNQSQSHSNLEGFNQNILFKLYNTSTQIFSDLDLSGDYKFYLDIDAYGTNISNPGSFRFKLANAGPSGGQFFYPTHPSIDVTWTNTLQSNYSLQTPNIITNNAPNGNSIIQLTTPNIDPFEGMFVVITNTTGSIYGNSYVSSVNTSDVAIVDFGTLIFGDTLQISDLGSLQVYNGSTFVKSSSSGNWGVGILTGSLAFTQILLDEYLYGQTVVIESPSMRLVTSEVNKQSSDGSGLRPNYVNPIGRLKESRTNLADVQYVFKRGAFYTLTDEWDYDGFEIKRNVDTIVKTTKNITGPNNPVTGVGSVPKTTTVPNAFGQVISKQIITSISSSVAAGTITSLPIALINDVIFKIGDYFNVLNSDTNEFIKFELNGQQFSDSSSLTVVSQVIADNIPANSIITFNAFDLTSQYQNKTRGTVGAFDITATSIDSGSVAISSYIDDDTFATASVNSLATSESIKAYVDGQAGLTENLQTVTDNGNTTTNSIMIGSSSSPQELLHLRKSSTPRLLFTDDTTGHTDDDGFFIGLSGSQDLNFWNYENTAIRFATGSTEKARITSGGSLLIGTTSSSRKLCVQGTNNTALSIVSPNTNYVQLALGDTDDDNYAQILLDNNTNILQIQNGGGGIVSDRGITLDSSENVGINISSPTEKLHVVGKIKLQTTAGSLIAQDFGSTSVKLTSSSTLGIEAPANFRVKTGGNLTESFTVMHSGNVGINQVNPTEKLHVVGDALITGDSHADAFKPAVAANPIKFKNFASTEVARITDGGNLLLGTTTDNGEKLVVNGDIKLLNTANKIKFGGSGTTATWSAPQIARISAFMTMSDYSGVQLGGYDGTSYGPRFTVYGSGAIGFNNSYGTSGQVLKSNGNTYPTWVDASSVIGGPYLPLTGGTLTGSLTGTTATFSGDVSIDSGSNSQALIIDSTSNTLLRFRINGASAGFIQTTLLDFIMYNAHSGSFRWLENGGTERMRLTDSGQLLVGLTTSSNIVAFKDVADIEFDLDGSDAAMNFNSIWRTGVRASGSSFRFAESNTSLGTNVRMTIETGGQITLPSYGSGTFTGAETYFLAVTSGGDVVEADSSALPGGPYLPLTGGTMDSNASINMNSGLFTNVDSIDFGIGQINGVSSFNFIIKSLGDITYNSDSNNNGSSSHIFQESGTEKMRLTSTGLGIGATNPTAKLHVNSAANTVLKIQAGINSSASLRLINDAQNWDLNTQTNDTFAIYNQTSGTQPFSILPNGNVGIFNTNPTVAFEVGVNSTGNTKRVVFNGEGGNATNLILKSRTNRSTLILSDNDTTVYFVAEGSKSSWGFGSNVNSSNNILIDNSGNVAIGSTITNSGAKLHITGIIRTTGGSVQAGQDYGFTLEDESNNNRYGLKFGAAGSVGGSNLLMLTNRSLSSATGGGEVAIGANASTSGVTETEVMRIKANTQSEVSIDGILSLTVQDTPADPSNNKSSIWLDSNWDLKIKITNSSGDTVTKTIVEYA